jgi:RNA polymerase sigma factor (sigma-70 family)
LALKHLSVPDTHNLSADYYHQKQVHVHHVGDEEESDIIADPQQGPEATIDAELRLQLYLNILHALPKVYQHVFLLHRFDGLTYAEIGQALSLPTRTVERYAAKGLDGTSLKRLKVNAAFRPAIST